MLNNFLITITFSKLNVLHPSIITTDELLQQLIKIEKFLPNQLLIKPEISNIELFEQIIQLSAYHTQSRIVFLLNVPITSKIQFALHHSYALPVIHNSLTQIPTAKYFLNNENTYMFTNDPCMKTRNNIFLYLTTEIKQIKNKSCEEELLQRKTPYKNCDVKIIETTWKLQKLEDNSWLYFELDEEVCTLKCPNLIRKIDVRGSYLIQLPKECALQIHGETFFPTLRK